MDYIQLVNAVDAAFKSQQGEKWIRNEIGRLIGLCGKDEVFAAMLECAQIAYQRLGSRAFRQIA